MLVLSRVCAEFHDHTGAVVHRVTPETRLTFREAPESIREDPLFRMLINDGSLEAAPSAAQKKQLEAEPLEGVNAEGRRIAAPPVGATPAILRSTETSDLHSVESRRLRLRIEGSLPPVGATPAILRLRIEGSLPPTEKRPRPKKKQGWIRLCVRNKTIDEPMKTRYDERNKGM